MALASMQGLGPALGWILFASLLGPISHYLYFIRGEHHLRAPIYLNSVIAIIILCSFSAIRNVLSLWLGLDRPLLSLLAYLTSLFMSIANYRLFFHPIRQFPGPTSVALSQLWRSWLVWRYQNYRVLADWHTKYGDFVRTGPNEITVFHSEALAALHDSKTTCTKADWYDIMGPYVALNTTRDKEEHHARRKAWNPSFRLDVLPNYDAVYENHNRKFVALLLEMTQLNIVEPIYRWSFDVMGEITFSKSFETLTKEHFRHHLRTLRRFTEFLGPLSPVPWLLLIGANIPGVMRGWNRMFRLCQTLLANRMESESDKPDIASNVARSNPDQYRKGALVGDVVAMVIAGSDTLACALVYALFELAKSEEHQNTLLAELRNNGIQASSPPKASVVQRLPFLCAFINETLRLHQPVPAGLPRIAGPDGLTIAGRFIPPFTTIVAPRWHIARSSDCFHNPDQFDPSRWLNGDQRTPHIADASAPFISGRYGCIGRGLAVRQAQTFVATIVSRFQVQLAEGEEGKRVEDEMRENFMAYPGPLKLEFNKRAF